MDPSKIMAEIGGTQEKELKNKFLTMGNGLGEMGSKLIEIGRELGSKDIANPGMMVEKLKELSNIGNVFDDLIGGQDKLDKGVTELGGGLKQSSLGLSELSSQLIQLAEGMKSNPEIYTRLNTLATNIEKNSEGLLSMSEKTELLSQGNQNTSQALSNLSLKLEKELTDMKNAF